MREVDGNPRAPVVRDDMADHQREVVDGETRASMTHRGADQDLTEDQSSRHIRKAAQSLVFDGSPLPIPAR